MEIEMAYFLRKVAIIGLIAVNSPVHSGKPADASLPQNVRHAVEAAQTGVRHAAGSMTAAREAAEILSGLDPALRERILNAAMTTATAKPAAR
jgi:Mg/Co/Ni transporter MgtE